VANTLADYVGRLKKEGYDEPTIKSHLFSEGYSLQQINESLSPRRGLPTINKKTLVFLGGALGIILIAAALYLLVFPTTKTISFAMKPASFEIARGDKIMFEDVVTNTGKDAGFPVTIKHDVVNTNSLQVTSKQETMTASGVQTKQVEISLPQDLQPGRYTVKAAAVFDGKEITSAFSFRLIGEQAVEIPGPVAQPQPGEQPAAGCAAGCDDLDSCTTDSCVNSKCVYTDKPTCCGNLVCEADETTLSCPVDCASTTRTTTAAELADSAKSAAKSDPDKASILCSQIPQEGVADNCFTVIADEATNSGFCARVSDSEKRDNCFVSYVLKTNDFEVCSSIENVYLKRTCYNLRNLRAMQQAMASQGQA